MTLHVKGQVIRSRKTALAHFAPERFGASVLAIVTREFVGSGEAPLTLWPVTAIRFLSCDKQINAMREHEHRVTRSH